MIEVPSKLGLNAFAALFGSIAANIKDPAKREQAIALFAELHHELTINAARAECSVPRAEAIEGNRRSITKYVDSLLGAVQSHRKAHTAELN